MMLSSLRPIVRERRRNAFTLLEVLVVVAIVVVLASVSSVYVFRYLADAKKDQAFLQAKNIEKAAKAYMTKQETDPEMDPLTSIVQLVQPSKGAPFLEGGASAVTDPWGKQFSVSEGSGANGERIIEIWTTAPDEERISSAKRRS